MKHEILAPGIEIYQGDCLKILPTFRDIDMIITSPPYFNARDYSSWKTYGDYLLFIEEFLFKFRLILKNSGRIAINVPDGYGRNPWIPVYADYCKLLQKKQFVLRGSIVWHKMNGGGKTSWGSWRSSSNPCIIEFSTNI